MGLRSRLKTAARRILSADDAPDRGAFFPREPSADGYAPLLWDHEVGYDRAKAATLPDGTPGVLVCCRAGTYAVAGVDPTATWDPVARRLVAGGQSWDLFTGAGQGAPDGVPYAARSRGAVVWVGGPSAPPSIAEQVTVHKDPLRLTIPGGVYPPVQPAWRDIDEGVGDPAGPDSTFDADYMGVLWSTGAVYDSTWRRGRRYPVDMKSPKLLEGWRTSLLGLRPGGLRLVIVPPYLGYGEEEIEETVPGGETLLFLIQRAK